MITTDALIEKFKYALKNDFGYILNTAGQVWTASDQAKSTNKMTIEYGRQWIGHRVADCSGLFSWAFKQLGGYMYHGSNTMYKSYCTAKGTFSKGKRTDGKKLKPGTALFTGNENDRGHVGLYIGGDDVIEASGTKVGVIKSSASNKKWTFWGELKGVDYGKTEEAAKPVEDNQGFPDHSVWHATVRKGSKGIDVTDLQTYLYKLGYDIGPDGIDGDFGRNTEKAVREFQRDHLLTVDGVCGPMTWDALEKAVQSISEKPKVQLYTVSIHHLDKTQAEAMRNNYPGCTVTEE